MTTEALPIQFERSITPGARPDVSKMLEGAFYVNLADKIIITKDDKGDVIELGYNKGKEFGWAELDKGDGVKKYCTVRGRPIWVNHDHAQGGINGIHISFADKVYNVGEEVSFVGMAFIGPTEVDFQVPVKHKGTTLTGTNSKVIAAADWIASGIAGKSMVIFPTSEHAFEVVSKVTLYEISGRTQTEVIPHLVEVDLLTQDVFVYISTTAVMDAVIVIS